MTEMTEAEAAINKGREDRQSAGRWRASERDVKQIRMGKEGEEKWA